jgi:hypothetical protein
VHLGRHYHDQQPGPVRGAGDLAVRLAEIRYLREANRG